jgi:hypothetical protein
MHCPVFMAVTRCLIDPRGNSVSAVPAKSKCEAPKLIASYFANSRTGESPQDAKRNTRKNLKQTLVCRSVMSAALHARRLHA